MGAQDKETGAPSGAPTLDDALAILRQALANALRSGIEEYRLMLVEHRRFVRELDVALNGEVGAAPQASLCDLVAQVRRQQCVQILNMADGMRINFRAPDGRRSTMHLRVLLDQWALDPTMTRIYEPMRDAIAAYPVAGEPLPEAHSDAHDAAQVASLGASQVSPSMALPSQRIEE